MVERPKAGGSSVSVSVRPLWKQSALCANTNHRANTTQSNSESVSVEIYRTPRGTNNFGSPNMRMDRSPGSGAEAGAEMWHSQETAHDRPHTDSNSVLAWESVNPTLTFPTQLNSTQLNSTQRSGAVGFLPPPAFSRRRMSSWSQIRFSSPAYKH